MFFIAKVFQFLFINIKNMALFLHYMVNVLYLVICCFTLMGLEKWEMFSNSCNGGNSSSSNYSLLENNYLEICKFGGCNFFCGIVGYVMHIFKPYKITNCFTGFNILLIKPVLLVWDLSPLWYLTNNCIFSTLAPRQIIVYFQH